MDSATERALKAFDAFLQQWVAPAMLPHLFDTDANDGERVRNAIRAIAVQPSLPTLDNPVGYAVFAKRPDPDSDDGFTYDIVSAVFPTPEQAANAQRYCIDGRSPKWSGQYIVGEIRQTPKQK